MSAGEHSGPHVRPLPDHHSNASTWLVGIASVLAAGAIATAAGAIVRLEGVAVRVDALEDRQAPDFALKLGAIEERTRRLQQEADDEQRCRRNPR